MTLAFQLTIFDAGIAGQIPKMTTHAMFADVILAMMNDFGLLAPSAFVIPVLEPLESDSYRPRLPLLPEFDVDRGRDISLLLCHCHTLHLVTELNILVSRLAADAETMNLELFQFFFFSFLKTLGSTLLDHNIELQNSPFQTLFQQVLRTYIKRYVQPEPRPSRDWSRPTVVCDCQDCVFLNAFLANPKKQQDKFNYHTKRRDHIYSKVADTEIDQYTDTSHGTHYTLVLTKNGRYFEIVHKAWTERGTVAKRHLQDMDSEIGLGPFLGDLYDPIISLSILSRGAAPEYRQLPPPPSTLAGTHLQGLSVAQPLAPMAHNIQGALQLSSLSSMIAEDWRSLPPLSSHRKPETRIIPQGTKRKASDNLEQAPKRKAQEVIVIDD